MVKINNIDQLIKHLDYGPGYEGYVSVIKGIEFTTEALTPYCSWNAQHYTRNCIARSSCYELLVMCWEPGQQTQIHDYNTNLGWILIMQGELTEALFHKPSGEQQLVSQANNTIKTGQFVYLNDGIGLHQFTNTSHGRTISLHLYAYPITSWNVYNEKLGLMESQKVDCDTEHNHCG